MIKLPTFRFWLVNSSALFCLLASSPTAAQIVPDATLPVNSSVTPDGNTSIITEGTRAGSNLFHSFEQFSLPTGSAAYFKNASDIQNIISRVTGSSISNIDGLIRANASANLFLLNPNGIIFGPNATLAIGGSILVSTASSLNFTDGTQFSATAHPTTPLLTVSVPLGLQFGSNPRGIHVQGTGHNLTLSNSTFSPFTRGSSSTGLQVNPGKTLALVGGDVELSGGTLKTAGGRIELGSVGGSSLVRLTPIDKGWYLNYEGVPTFGNMQLKQRTAVDASGVGSGSIQVQGANVTLTDGSVILIQNQGSQPGGNLSVNASESLELSGTSPDGLIPTSLINETVRGGNGGDIGISTKRLIVQGGAGISTRTYSTARGGNLNVSAPESVQVIGFSPIKPSVFSLIGAGTFSFGNAGDVTVNTERLTARGGGNLGSVTLGKGNGGSLTVNATDVELNGVAPTSMPSALFASTGSAGDAGRLTINASRVGIRDGAVISSSTAASGNSGSITINASDFVEVSGTAPTPTRYTSNIISAAALQTSFLQQAFGLPSIPSGASGDVTINTHQLRVTDRGQVDVRNEGPGNAGTLRVNANFIVLDNFGRLVAATTSGEGGNVILQSQNLQLRHNSLITTTAVGSGNGGNLTVNTDTLVALENSNITAQAVQGRGGNIQINTQGLFLSPDSDITATSKAGPQFSGIVQINTLDVDPSRAIVQKVAQPETPKLASACQRGSGMAASEFVITGTGGIPPSPSDLLYSNRGWEDAPQNRVPDNFVSPATQQLNSDSTMLVEAQGWRQNPDGTITLTAEANTVVPYSSLSTPSCHTQPSLSKVPSSRNAASRDD